MAALRTVTSVCSGPPEHFWGVSRSCLARLSEMGTNQSHVASLHPAPPGKGPALFLSHISLLTCCRGTQPLFCAPSTHLQAGGCSLHSTALPVPYQAPALRSGPPRCAAALLQHLRSKSTSPAPRATFLHSQGSRKASADHSSVYSPKEPS